MGKKNFALQLRNTLYVLNSLKRMSLSQSLIQVDRVEVIKVV